MNFKYILIITTLLLVSCKKEDNIDDNTVKHLLLGNPSAAASSDPNNYLIERQQYSLSYNNSKHIANWVSWHLEKNDFGSAERTNIFKTDSTLPFNWYRVKYTDYTNSGFDRGHLCPSADRTNSEIDNATTFLMTNIVPQAPKINSNTWMLLESYCRKLANNKFELYISTGTFGEGGIGNNGSATTLKNNVCIPSHFWKIAIVMPQGTDDLKRINTLTRVIAVIIPNNQLASSKPWTYYKTTVDAIESATGLNFLNNINPNIQEKLEQKVDTIE